MSLFGVWVVELEFLLNNVMKGSTNLLCNQSHSMEYGLMAVHVDHLDRDWLASSMRTIAWCCCYNS
jgi:hypothetical protein